MGCLGRASLWRLALVAVALGAGLSLFPTAASAQERVALVIGNNRGARSRHDLRFAESDALRFAEVLVELGGFARSDVYLLRGAALARVRLAMNIVRGRLANWRHTSATKRLELLVYYSGHSDGFTFELGDERLSFSELRAWAKGAGADLRFMIVDSCRSGGILSSKGGRPGPGFELPELPAGNEGDVFISSSASNEAALESARLGASFFSHNLISAMRGAADHNADGHVTVSEAYSYAYDRTLSGTADTVYGGQHPGFDIRVSGRGDIFLTTVRGADSSLGLPEHYDRFLVTTANDAVVAETGGKSGRWLGVRPGRYRIRAWRGVILHEAHVTVAPHEHLQIPSELFSSMDVQRVATRGGPEGADGIVADSAESAPTTSLAIEAGAGAGAPQWTGATAWGVRLGVGPAHSGGLFASVEVMRDTENSRVRTDPSFSMGYRLMTSVALGGVLLEPRVGMAVRAGLLSARAERDADSRDSRFATGLAPSAGLALVLAKHLVLTFDLEAIVSFVPGATQEAWSSAPRAWLGLAWLGH